MALADLLFPMPPEMQQLANLGQPPGMPPGGPPPAAGGPPGQGGPAPGPGGPAPQQPQQPQYQQSPPDLTQMNQALSQPNLVSLMLKMQQRQMAMEGFNRGLGLIAAGFAPPSDRAMIMQSQEGMVPSAGETMGGILKMYQMQQQQAGQAAMLANADQYDQRLNLPPGTARAEIMAGNGNALVSSLMPSEQQKNIQFQHDQFIKGGGSESEWSKNILPNIMMMSLPGVTPDYLSYYNERKEWMDAHPGQAIPDKLQDFTRWRAQLQTDTNARNEKTTQINSALSQFSATNQVLTTMQGQTERLQSAYDQGKLDKLFNLPQGWEKMVASNDWANLGNRIGSFLGLGGYTLSDEERGYLKDILALQGAPLQSLTATSPRHIAQALGTIGTALGPVGDLSVGKKGWGEKLGDLHNQILNTEADNYGGSGQTPPTEDLRQRMNPIYAAGGDMSLRPATPIPADELQSALADLKQHPENFATILRGFKAQNRDTTALERAFNNQQQIAGK